jgi:hypothetical protein
MICLFIVLLVTAALAALCYPAGKIRTKYSLEKGLFDGLRQCIMRRRNDKRSLLMRWDFGWQDHRLLRKWPEEGRRCLEWC